MAAFGLDRDSRFVFFMVDIDRASVDLSAPRLDRRDQAADIFQWMEPALIREPERSSTVQKYDGRLFGPVDLDPDRHARVMLPFEVAHVRGLRRDEKPVEAVEVRIDSLVVADCFDPVDRRDLAFVIDARLVFPTSLDQIVIIIVELGREVRRRTRRHDSADRFRTVDDDDLPAPARRLVGRRQASDPGSNDE